MGLQIEQFSQVNVTVNSQGSVNDSTPVTIRGELRFAGDWTTWPSMLSRRLRTEGTLLRVSRTDTVISISGQPQSVSTATGSTQLEVYARAYAVIDALGFLGGGHATTEMVV